MFTRRTLIASAVIGMAGLSMVTLTGCSSESPTDVALAFTKAMYEGDGKTALKFVDMSGAEEAQVKYAEGKISAVALTTKQRAEEDGGVKDITILKEPNESDASKDTVSVKLEVLFENGKTKRENVRLVMKDGVWKVKL